MGRWKSVSALVKLWVGVAVVWGLSGCFTFYSMSTTERGTFGDMFGAVNALFSGLAFGTLIYTAWMQSQELSLQREELEATREELKGQREQMELQAKTLALQQFESTFFSLLRMQGEIVGAMKIWSNGEKIEGRECFEEYYSQLRSQYAVYPQNPDDRESDLLSRVRSAYKDFFLYRQSLLGHYFRHLYHIIKFVKTAPVENKRQYTSLVRAQLSSYEHILLFYNCLGEDGYEKFKPLVEEFALLENMPIDLLFNRQSHPPLYAAQAYGQSPPAL
ncbi:putative phage abortive infection protein [Uliginosibacterium sp. H3]|uniref:Phage abortive infection protein n=1 Tax=Uliginosibacterium silvisoli TaxID=3114758 RepID=A0ABU6K687_9RHOO|nr:putative phage abortive infection protein [Uliginosibacterium sp. H3]